MPDRPNGPEGDDTEHGFRGPSRSQKKRDARAVAGIGVVLTKLSRNQLKKVPLDDDLRAAILSCHGLTRGALARQIRYIAQQLNETTTDLVAIKNALADLDVLG